MKTNGSCHCGNVRFVVEGACTEVLECNCSICARVGYLHWIVSREAFILEAGAETLVEYRFGKKVARHTFCGRCGVKAFYVPRSHPDGVSVNARCLDDVELSDLKVRPFDGRNWERARHALDSE